MAVKNKQEVYLNPKKPLILSGFTAISIFIFESFIMGAPMISTFVLIYLVVYLIPVTLFSFRNKPKLRFMGSKLAIYTLMVIACFGFRAYDLSLAEKRSEMVISAVDQYYRDKGEYPDSLFSLVPVYLSDIPKPRIAPGVFYYFGAPNDPFLMYADTPPFGRLSWSFRNKEWTSLD